MGLLHDAPTNETYLARLSGWLLDGAQEAVATARPARVGWAAGQAHIGYNRRLCWRDGTHSMYGDATRPDFAGIEGPDDPAHTILFAVDDKDRYVGLAQANCCHATCMEGGTQATADFPGEARRLLRLALGSNLPVLYLQGASGDISPWNLLRQPRTYDGELRAREIGAALAAETLRLVHEAELRPDLVLGHALDDVPLAVRLPTEAELARARSVKAAGEEKAGRGEYVLKVDGVLRLHDEFGKSPVDTLALHAVRAGDLALATNPCELYCQFGLDLRRRSPGTATAVVQLADGFSGYCPTIYGHLGGGYSGEALYWCRLESGAGYKLVDATARLLHSLWH